MDASATYNALTDRANWAVNEGLRQIDARNPLPQESNDLIRSLVEENNQRVRMVTGQLAVEHIPEALARHQLETLELVAAYLEARAEAIDSDAAESLLFVDCSSLNPKASGALPMPKRVRWMDMRPFGCRSSGMVEAGRRVVCLAGHESRGQHRAIVLCRCACGRYFLALEHDVLRGRSKHCGPDCSTTATKPKRAGPKLYTAYHAMRSRCENPNNPKYPDYGGRGIKVSPEWDNFEAFARWALANGYRHDLTLDREDNDGDYTPSNCRWVTWTVQANNKRTNIIIGFHGRQMTLKQAAQLSGLPYSALLQRYHTHGERDLFRPLQQYRRKEVTKP